MTAFAIDGAQIFSLKKSQIETTPGKVETIEISVQLPTGFRAYSEQLSIRKFTPSDFKWGQVRLQPETEFFDKFSKKNKRGIFETGHVQFQVESPEKINLKSQKVKFELRYQLCSEKICYVPKNHVFDLTFNFGNVVPTGAERAPSRADSSNHPAKKDEFKTAEPRPAKPQYDSLPNDSYHSEISGSESVPVMREVDRPVTINNTSSKFNFSFAKFDPNQGIALTLLAIFIAGLLTSFTPCIFPMIPITLSILGHNADKNSRAKNLSRSIVYVLGIATTYAVLGVAAALTGSLFGRLLAHPGVIWSMSILFIALAFSMWGFFEIQAPAFIRAKFQSGQVEGYSGIFGMGLVAGIVASPCVGPVLISILSFVSTTQNAWLGFLYLFVYALGLGLIFIVIGLFSEAIRLLPKSGVWMDQVKFILGLLMVGAALYYVQFVMNDQAWIIFASIGIGAIFVWKIIEGLKKRRKIQLLISGIVIAGAITSTVISIVNPSLFKVKSLHTQVDDKDLLDAKKTWAPYSDAVMEATLRSGKPTIIDFYAEWCAACHELKEKTFSQTGFRRLSERFNLVVFDATEDTEENQKILTQFEVKGLPTVIFLNKSGDRIEDLTFTQFIEWPELEVKMREALK